MEFSEVVGTRRSVHEYSDEPLDEETLRSIVEMATLSPSGYNLQPWEFLAVRNPDRKATLQEVAYGQDHVTQADTTLVVLGNTNPSAHADPVFDDWLAKGYLPDESVRDGLVENVAEMAQMPATERRVWTTRSTALAAMTLMLAAWDEGIASCPMEGFDADALVEEFDVPDGYEPVMLITLGYPAEGTADIENDRKERRSVDEVLHIDEFDPVKQTAFDED